MISNVSRLDRIGRVVLGIALLFLFFAGPKSVWGLIGVVPLMTGLLGWCPLYQALGWSTKRPPRAGSAS